MIRIFASLAVMFATLSAFAQEGQPSGGSSVIGQMLPMMLILFAVIYFLMIRPEQKKQKKRQEMINAIKKGDKVITAGGIHGVVNSVKDQTVMVKVGEGALLEVTKGSIAAAPTQESEKASRQGSK